MSARNYGLYTGDKSVAEVLAAVGATGEPDDPLATE